MNDATAPAVIAEAAGDLSQIQPALIGQQLRDTAQEIEPSPSEPAPKPATPRSQPAARAPELRAADTTKAALASLERAPAPAGEAVAFLYVLTDGSKELVLDCNGEQARRLLALGYTETPLFAATPQPTELALPDIGEDPMKGPRVEDRYEASRLRLREAYVRQQRGVPDQTALVWRYDLGTLLEMAIRLKSILEDETPAPLSPPPSGEGEGLRTLLDDLQQAEAEYRLMHDRHGDGSRAAGRAWDLMRRAGDKARAALSPAEQAGEGEQGQ